MSEEITNRVNDFFRKALGFIDKQDLSREFNDVQLKYGKELLKKDIEINGVQAQIDNMTEETNKYNSSSDNIRNNLTQIQNSLNL